MWASCLPRGRAASIFASGSARALPLRAFEATMMGRKAWSEKILWCYAVQRFYARRFVSD